MLPRAFIGEEPQRALWTSGSPTGKQVQATVLLARRNQNSLDGNQERYIENLF